MEIERSFNPERISIIRINGAEHNLKHLIDLLSTNGIEIKSLAAQNPSASAENEVTTDSIPVVWSEIKVNGSYQQIRSILEKSDEFKQHVDTLLGAL